MTGELNIFNSKLASSFASVRMKDVYNEAAAIAMQYPEGQLYRTAFLRYINAQQGSGDEPRPVTPRTLESSARGRKELGAATGVFEERLKKEGLLEMFIPDLLDEIDEKLITLNNSPSRG